MHPLDEMKLHVGYTDADAARLAGFWPTVAPEVPAILDRFYARIALVPAAAAVVSPERVPSLHATLAAWIAELFLGPHDLAYFARRERIGHRHVEVALPSRFMFTAMSALRVELTQLALAHHGANPENCALLVESIDRITSIDLGIMTGSYLAGHEAAELASLQDLIVSHLPVTVLLADASGAVTAATRPGVRLFGGQQSLVGRPWRDAVPRELLAAGDLEARVAHALAARREIAVERVDAELDGRSRSFRFSIVPLEHPLARILLHVEELTEAVETEARLRRKEALAQLGELSAAVAHELRNPLAGISGAVQVIARSLPSDDRRRPVLDKVELQIKRLNELVTDLLAFARPETARMGDVDLAEVARHALAGLSPERPEVVVDVAGAGHGWGDPNLLAHILTNLVQNATQAIEGAGRVHVDVADGLVRVSDSGPGVPNELADRIFKPFFTTRTRGTGLGLAICTKAATAMGGSLALARPRLGAREALAGACFTIRLQPRRSA